MSSVCQPFCNTMLLCVDVRSLRVAQYGPALLPQVKEEEKAREAELAEEEEARKKAAKRREV